MIFYFKNKKLETEEKEAKGIWRVFGLMFKTKNTKNLLFNFPRRTKMAIHSFFVFFPFLAVWLDEKNEIIEMKIVAPFTPHIKPSKKYNKLIELPLNNKNKKILEILVGKETFK